MRLDTESTVLVDIVEQHADNAAFLWHLRDLGVQSPLYDLEDLLRLDDRVDANLDGVRIAANAGWEICKVALSIPDSGKTFAAAVLSIERSDAMGFAQVLKVGAASPTLAKGIVSALGWVPLSRSRRFIDELLAADCPSELHYLGIAGAAAHRLDPGPPLANAVASDDVRLKARALRAVGQLGRMNLMRDVRRELEAEDAGCRLGAAWSAALFGERAATDILWNLARGQGPDAERACDMAARRTDPAAAHRWLIALAESQPRTALVGAAALGDPALVPWLIGLMERPATARFAGFALTMITGIDLAAQKLEGKAPEGFNADPTDNPLDENVAMDPDRRLPWPDVTLVRAFWKQKGFSFGQGARLLLGKPMTAEWLAKVLRGGRQPARAAAAIELSRMHLGQPLFEVRAPAFRQHHLLAGG